MIKAVGPAFAVYKQFSNEEKEDYGKMKAALLSAFGMNCQPIPLAITLYFSGKIYQLFPGYSEQKLLPVILRALYCLLQLVKHISTANSCT